MNRTAVATIALIGVLGLGTGACVGGGEDPPAGEMQGMPMGEPRDDMPGMESMQRHGHEADSMAAVMRQHLTRMRQVSPDKWYELMGEHVTQVSHMLTMMNRQMREMDMGMGMSDEQMGQMMGMTGEEHRRMIDEMQALRNDLEHLQTAPRDDAGERMPDHLDRLERMTQMIEHSAAHMRSP